MDAHRWNLRVQTTEKGTARVFARRHQFEVGAPVDFDQEAKTVTALEYALGALGAELAGGLKRLADERRMDLAHVEAVVQAELNDPLAALGVVGAKGHPGIERIAIKVFVSTNVEMADLEPVWKETLASAPLFRTFQAVSTVEVELKSVP